MSSTTITLTNQGDITTSLTNYDDITTSLTNYDDITITLTAFTAENLVLFIPLGSDKLVTSAGKTFRVKEE